MDIREVARQAAETAERTTPCHDDVVYVMADAVAVATLKEVEKLAIPSTSTGGVEFGLILLPSVQALLAAFTPAEPPQQETKVMRAPTTEAETVADPHADNRDGSNYQEPLTVGIEDSALVIRIGIQTLAHAVTYSDWANRWNDEADDYIREFAIENAHQFAKDVASMMEREEEDGSSLLSNLIDKASEEAVNDGSLGLAEGDHKIKHGEKSPLEKW